MDIKKFNPWNWLSREESHEKNIPVQRNISQPYGSLMQLHQEIDRMIGDIFHNFGLPLLGDTSTILRPQVDIASTETEYTITVEIPGVEEKDIRLELAADSTLVIRGEKKQETEQKEKNFYRIERSYGSFQRVLSLPDDANENAIEASFKNGVLTIVLARKAVAQTSARRIEIKTAA